MPDLTVALVQSNPVWEDVTANLAHLSKELENIDADLFVLPEMFNTGFTSNVEACAEKQFGQTFEWMKSFAEKKQCCITGSIIIEEDGHYYNRLYFANPFGIAQHYDKKHLWMGKEQEVFTPGNYRLEVLVKGWKICPLICYDLRFPVWSRNFGHLDQKTPYDLLIYVASWPAARSHHWKSLLQARAIENLAYTVGVNRVGEDGNGVFHTGASTAFDYKGERLEMIENEVKTSVLTFSKSALEQYRIDFPAWKDADSFSVKDRNLKPLSEHLVSHLFEEGEMRLKGEQ